MDDTANGHTNDEVFRATKEIMGENYFGVDEMMDCWGVRYTPEQLKKLSQTEFEHSFLAGLKEDNTLLLPGFPISIYGIADKVNPQLFRARSDYDWPTSKAQKRLIGLRWFLLPLQMFDRSPQYIIREIGGQYSECLPYACELVYSLSTYILQNRLPIDTNMFGRNFQCADREDTADGTVYDVYINAIFSNKAAHPKFSIDNYWRGPLFSDSPIGSAHVVVRNDTIGLRRFFKWLPSKQRRSTELERFIDGLPSNPMMFKSGSI